MVNESPMNTDTNNPEVADEKETIKPSTQQTGANTPLGTVEMKDNNTQEEQEEEEYVFDQEDSDKNIILDGSMVKAASMYLLVLF